MILSNEKPLIPMLSCKGLFLTVTLDGTDNQVWRSLVVPADGHLGWLHAVLQISMGWTARHLHQFTFKDKRFSDPSFELYDPLTIDEAKGRLDKLLVRPTDVLKYQYDFGASWEHTIVLKKIDLIENPTVALCLDGSGARPPEDCGGTKRYKTLLKTAIRTNELATRTTKQRVRPIHHQPSFNLPSINLSLQALPWPSVSSRSLKRIIRDLKRPKQAEYESLRSQ